MRRRRGVHERCCNSSAIRPSPHEAQRVHYPHDSQPAFPRCDASRRCTLVTTGEGLTECHRHSEVNMPPRLCIEWLECRGRPHSLSKPGLSVIGCKAPFLFGLQKVSTHATLCMSRFKTRVFAVLKDTQSQCPQRPQQVAVTHSNLADSCTLCLC